MAETPRTEQDEQQHIVVIDDNPDDLRLLAGILEKRGYMVRPVPGGDSLLTTIRKDPPDLILLDLMMPETDGYEICRQLKSEARFKDIPVIFLSGSNELFDKVKAFKAGIVDFIAKPLQEEEVIVRVDTHLTIRRQQTALARKKEELLQKNILIAEQTRRLAHLATRDFLTGISSRRDFLERARQEENRCNRTGRSFALILLDIDHFKAVNDAYGHNCGDLVLTSVARNLEQSLRTQDIVARWGGEQFICLLPETEADGARQAAEKIRTCLADSRHGCGDVSVSITVTLGVSRYDGTCSIDACIKQAEDALHKGKENGRNQVMAEE